MIDDMPLFAQCLVPECKSVAYDSLWTRLCRDHFLELEVRIRERKSANPRFYRNRNANAIAHRLTKFDVLTFLGIDETRARGIAKSQFPLDFEEKLIGEFPNDPELLRTVKHAVLPEKSLNIVSGR